MGQEKRRIYCTQNRIQRCHMRDVILSLMGEYGKLAVFLLILIENLFPPIPSEVILTFGGAMTVCTDMTAAGVILSATAGSVFGAVVLYLAGRLIPEKLLSRMLSGKPGKILRFEEGDVELARAWFARKGTAAVFLCRLVPIVRSLISIPAGMSRMPLAPFLVLTGAGSLMWNTVLVLLGRAAGDSWEKVTEAFGIYSDIFLMLLGTGAVLAVMIYQTKTHK